MLRSTRLALTLTLAAFAVSSPTAARAADPTLPPLTLEAASEPEPAPPFPGPRVRRFQIGGVREDRLQHASLSLALGLAAGLSTREPGAAASTFALGIAKELWDARRGGRFDVWDLVADALGTAASVGATVALQDQE